MQTSLPLCSLHTKTISLPFTTAPTAQLSALQNLRPNNILMVTSGNLGLLTALKTYSELRALTNAGVSLVHNHFLFVIFHIYTQHAYVIYSLTA